MGDVAHVLKTAIPLIEGIRNRIEPMGGADLLDMLDEGSVATACSARSARLCPELPLDDGAWRCVIGYSTR